MKEKSKFLKLFEVLFVIVSVSVIGGILFLSYYYNFKIINVENINDDKVLSEERMSEINENLVEVAMYNAEETFVGELTAYTGSCVGCSGILACKPRTNVLEKGVFFDDSEYGTIRIVAGDPSYPCGTIIKFNNSKMSEDPIIAVVMDRGGAIQGNIVDLLVETTEEANKYVGRMKNVQFEVLRYGW